MPDQHPFNHAAEAAQLPEVRPSRLRTWWARAMCVLARAEQRITENFRMPPS